MNIRKIILTTVFWIIIWVLIASFISYFTTDFTGILVISLVFVIFQAIMAYTNILILIPQFLKKKKIILYFLSVVLVIIALTTLRFSLPGIYENEINIKRPTGDQGNITGFVFNILIVYLISTAYHFIMEWFRNNQISVELKNKQLETELKYLKSQINPHFLFNTLNNIYTLCYLKDDKAAPSVMKLSEIMRYMLHESNVEKIGLKKEIKFLENYIDLHRLKKDNPDSIHVDFSYSGVKSIHKIAPLILIVFFENSFKHGNIDSDPNGWISAEIKVDEQDFMHLKIKNSKSDDPSNFKEKSHLGLANAQKRLHMQYKENYRLNIDEKSDFFEVNLDIPLEI